MDRRRLLAILLPSGVSVGVHLALLALIAAVSITAVRLAREDDPARDVVVTLDAPAPTAAPARSDTSIPEDAGAALAVAPVLSAPRPGGLVAPPIATGVPPPALPPAGAPAIDMRRAVAPGAAFAGLNASRVRRIVYVVDISGPMTSSLSFVLDEVRRSVSRLEPSQVFQVVLFRQDLDAPSDPGTFVLQGPTSRLLPATPANRAALAQFLSDVRPGGRSNPLAGLRRALAWEPDVIFLLARGIARTGPDSRWGEGAATILARLDELNPVDARGRRRTAIKTVQFVDDDPTGLMQAIAAAHGNTPSDPESSYSRRNVENLSGDRPTGLPQIESALDPSLDRAAGLLGDLSSKRLDLRAVFQIADDAEVDTVRQTARQAVQSLEGTSADDDLASLTLARALTLQAATEPAARGPLLDRAIGALDTGQGAPPEVLGTAAMARALRRAPGDAAEAERLARRVLELDPTTLGALEARLAAIAALADDAARVEPWVADLEASAARGPLTINGRLDAGLVLLAFDAAARARLTFAKTPERIEDALSVHLRWWEEPRPGLASEAVLARAGVLLGDGAPLDQLAPEFSLARGLALLPAPGVTPSAECLRALDAAALRDRARRQAGADDRGDVSGVQPGARSAAAATESATANAPASSRLAGPVTRPSVGESASIRAAMAVSLAAAATGEANAATDSESTVGSGNGPGTSNASGIASAFEASRRDAVARLDGCLAEFPARSWRRDAALHLLTHTGVLLREHEGDDTLVRPRIRALECLVIEDPRPDASGSLDAWRLELAQRLARSDDGDGAQEQRALDLLAGEWGERPVEAIDRLSAWIFARRVARHMADLAIAQRAGDEPAIRDAAARAIAQARPGIAHAARVEPAAADALRADLAEALMSIGDPEASRIYADLRSRGVVLAGSARVATLGEARALHAQGDEAGAFGVLRELTAAMGVPPEDAEERDVFWGAWSLVLEILAERSARLSDDDARRTGVAHLLRLQALDPTLGGEGWRPRLESTAFTLGLVLPESPTGDAVHSPE